MYTAPDRIREYFDKAEEKDSDHNYAAASKRPFFQCEYCHAMGNGPGNLEDYFQVFQSYDGACGGMVWEWCDHAIYKGRTIEGKEIYYYGGDHGEYPHDSNFCMDGLVYPDRRPHTGLKEHWNVFRPARVAEFDAATGRARIHNYMDFLNLKDYCTLRWEVSCDGQAKACGTVEDGALLDIAPHGEGEIKLDIPAVTEPGKKYLKVTWILKEDNGVLKAGREMGFDEVELDAADQCVPARKLLDMPMESQGGGLTVQEDDHYVTVASEKFCYTYDKFTGLEEILSDLWNV